MGLPTMIDTDLLIQAGLDPTTGLPTRIDSLDKFNLKNDIKRSLRILDEQNAVNRYIWYNLPSGLDGQLLERILYYKGQAAFFYLKTNEAFYFLPYALSGTIDVYGRFQGITPIAFGNGTTENEKNIKPWITGLVKKPIYDILMEDDPGIIDDGCVLLHDYSKQLAQTIIPRSVVQDPIIDAMSEAFPFARTSLISNSGVKGMRVNDEDQKAIVKTASRSITRAALTGDPWIPIVGQIDFQELTEGTALKSAEYLQYMQALDNFRLSLYGLKNGGIFEKDGEYVNSTTAGNIQNNVGLVYQDGLTIRQKFCDLVNSIWGLGIWCESSETVTNMDTNMDGKVEDDQDQSGIPGEQPQQMEAE